MFSSNTMGGSLVAFIGGAVDAFLLVDASFVDAWFTEDEEKEVEEEDEEEELIFCGVKIEKKSSKPIQAKVVQRPR